MKTNLKTNLIKKKYSAEARAHVLKAFAHPARLTMVEALMEGSRCVCELQELVGSDMSTISRHLSVLRNAGVVIGEKRGTQIHYRLTCSCIADFLVCVNQLCFDRLENEAARMRGFRG